MMLICLSSIHQLCQNRLFHSMLPSSTNGPTPPINRPLKAIFGRQQNAKGPKVLGLAGSTCTGKTSLAAQLLFELSNAGLRAELVGQDQFYKPPQEVPTLRSAAQPSLMFYDYDCIESLYESDMLTVIQRAKMNSSNNLLDVLLVEGNMVTDLPAIGAHIDATVFLTIQRETCRQRRALRVYEPPDEAGYFDQVVWPAYECSLRRTKQTTDQQHTFAFIESMAEKHIAVDELIVVFQHLLCDRLELRQAALQADEALRWIASPACGANSLFTGTTRDTFEGKRVLRLDYEAYTAMAYEEMACLCREVRSAVDPNILRIFIGHRIGCVPISETSVVIGASAPQRAAAMAATQWLIDQLKKRVPIWKREVYEDGTSSWKENSEQQVDDMKEKT